MYTDDQPIRARSEYELSSQHQETGCGLDVCVKGVGNERCDVISGPTGRIFFFYKTTRRSNFSLVIHYSGISCGAYSCAFSISVGEDCFGPLNSGFVT